MSESKSQIECPHCGESFSITDALASEVESKFEKQFQAKMAKAEATLKATLEQKLKKEVSEKSRVEMEDLKAQVEETSKRLEQAQKQELELRKRSRELEKKEKDVELELERRLSVAKATLAEEVTNQVSDEFRQKVAEKDQQLESMRKHVEDLKRRSEQGSQQLQGEAFELQIEAALKAQFPGDVIEPVAKGTRGADIQHKVMTTTGQVAGIILWELKRTKTWIDGWVPKLKDDQRAISAEFAVLVSDVLPKGARSLGQVDGVWVVSSACHAGLAAVLRQNVLQLYLARNASVGKGEKMEEVYQYLTGTRFRQRVEAIVEAYANLLDGVQSEKTAYTRIWAARERQLLRVMESTVGMYGDVSGIVGATLPRIERLELTSMLEDTESEADGAPAQVRTDPFSVRKRVSTPSVG